MSGLSEVPDYNKQVYSDRPVGVIFEEDPDKKPNYDKQGNEVVETADSEREGRRGRVPREPSGATGARSSSSISRSRSRQPRTALRDEGSGEARHASMSPSRAMGTRSVSIDRNGKPTHPIYTKLNTLEGIGSSVTPQVNPDAFDDRRGRSVVVPEGDREIRYPLGSPTGARSVSRNRQPSDFRESLNI